MANAATTVAASPDEWRRWFAPESQVLLKGVSRVVRGEQSKVPEQCIPLAKLITQSVEIMLKLREQLEIVPPEGARPGKFETVAEYFNYLITENGRTSYKGLHELWTLASAVYSGQLGSPVWRPTDVTADFIFFGKLTSLDLQLQLDGRNFNVADVSKKVAYYKQHWKHSGEAHKWPQRMDVKSGAPDDSSCLIEAVKRNLHCQPQDVVLVNNMMYVGGEFWGVKAPSHFSIPSTPPWVDQELRTAMANGRLFTTSPPLHDWILSCPTDFDWSDVQLEDNR